MAKGVKTKKANDNKPLTHGLYLVSTPIGNLEDFTQRALTVLGRVDIVAAEDTRVTKKNLAQLGVEVKKLVSYHEHNEDQSSLGLLEALVKGQSVAIVSDAGTPQISDPGFTIVKKAYEKNIPVIAIPGASSLSAALSVSPLGGGSVFYAGFLPSHAKARMDYLNSHKFVAHQLVFFEAPHRIKETLADIEIVFGPEQPVLVCRELTKPYEEVLFKTALEMKKYFNVNEPRGEFVIIVKGVEAPKFNREETRTKIQKLYEQGLSSSDIVEQLQPVSELTRKEIYDIVLSVKKI